MPKPSTLEAAFQHPSLTDTQRAELHDAARRHVCSIRDALELPRRVARLRVARLAEQLAMIAAYHLVRSADDPTARPTPRAMLDRLCRGDRPGRRGKAYVLHDRVLADALLHGDPGAQEAFLRRYKPWMVTRIESIVDPDALPDFEGFAESLVTPPCRPFAGFRSLDGLKPWLGRMLTSRWLDWLKAQSRRTTHLKALGEHAKQHDPSGLLAHPGDATLDPIDPGAPVPDMVAHRELVGALVPMFFDAVGDLDRDQEFVVRSILLDGLTGRKTATIMQRSESSVSVLLSKGLLHLRRSIDASVESMPEPTRTEVRELQEGLLDPANVEARATLAQAVAAALRIQGCVRDAIDLLCNDDRIALGAAMAADRPAKGRGLQALKKVSRVTLRRLAREAPHVYFGTLPDEVAALAPRFRQMVARLVD